MKIPKRLKPEIQQIQINERRENPVVFRHNRSIRRLHHNRRRTSTAAVSAVHENPMPASPASDLPPSAWAEPPSSPTSTPRGPTRSLQFAQSTATLDVPLVPDPGLPIHQSTTKFEDDLFVILKSVNFPYKINKSTLRPSNSPHNWPSYLALIHWMVQIASYTNQLLSNSRAFVEDNNKVTQLEGLQTGPTEREKLEKESSVVEEDVNKFNAMIAGFDERIRKMEELVEEKDKEMKEKLGEHKRICHENEELKKKVELQTFNAHDAERMKKELKAVERDIEDAETARSAWEDKCWDLDATFIRKFKELEALSIECNQAIRRLKLSNDIRYVSSAKGSTPAEVMGIDYKSTLKPTLESFADEVNKSSMEKLEDMISPQQQSSEMAAKIEGKRNRIAALQSYIDEVSGSSRKEMQEHTYRCAAEVKKMMEDVQIEAHNLDMVEREAAEVLKVVELKLLEAVRQSEEEIQIRACDLIALVDSVSKHKEYMESKKLL
ncbi:hypothetical protein EZV62_006557 [Acer yangbiense]|uniref:Kinetochore protein NDC80 n=1 Tax=Acer yangbiense TaxID=1000413 RepID=A0A5C7I9E0_9ROSI|nr:hypothetical protein EZV62_006557 [Acer yangbiense]